MESTCLFRDSLIDLTKIIVTLLSEDYADAY